MNEDTYRTIGAVSGLTIGIGIMFAVGLGGGGAPGLIAGAIFGAGGAVAGGICGEKIYARRQK